MSRAGERIPKPALVVLSVLFAQALAGCGEEDRHARVVVELGADVSSVASLHVAASLAGEDGAPIREQDATLPDGDGPKTLSFPADFVVLLGDAHGVLTVSVTGVDATGAAVAAGGDTSSIGAGGSGRVATLTVVLEAAGGSTGCGDGVVATGELCYSPAIAPTTLPAWGVRVADLDGDGLGEVLAAVGGDDPGRGLSIAHARGGDEFDAPETHFGPAIAGAGNADLALGDVDGDGRTDVVVSTSARQEPLVALGAPEPPYFGMLAPLRDAGAEAAGLEPVLADLDLDGDLDVVTLSHDAVWVALGDGDGTFTALGAVDVADPTSLAVGDVDDDDGGALEIVVVSSADRRLVVLDADLRAMAQLDVPEIRNAAVVEIDGAAPAEIVVGEGPNVQVLHLEAGTLVLDAATNVNPGRALAMAPLRLEDGRQGLAVLVDELRDELGFVPQVVELVPTNGRALEVRSRARVHCRNGTLTTADLERDGVDEALVTCEDGGVAIVRTEAGGGDIRQPLRGAFTWYLAVGEMDGDGRPDAVLVPWEIQYVRRADEPNATEFPEAVDGSSGGNLDVTFADFTGDARDDLASVCDELTYCPEGALRRWTATEGGAIDALPPVALTAEPQALVVARTVPEERVRLVVGMVDGGLVVVNGETGDVEDTSTGAPAPDFGLAAGPLDTAPGDEVVAIGGDGSVVVFRGDGTGGLEDGEPLESTPSPRVLVVADLDGDGLAEVVIGQRDSTRVQVLHLGAGGLEDAGSFEAAEPPQVGSALDLDLDGVPELVLAGLGRIDLWNLGASGPVLRKTLVGFGGYANAPGAWPRGPVDEADPKAPVLFVAGQPDLGEEGWKSYVMAWSPHS